MPTEFCLARLLEERGRSQAWLAHESGVAIRTISRLCRNETAMVSLATLDRIALALGCKPGDLIEQTKPKGGSKTGR